MPSRPTQNRSVMNAARSRLATVAAITIAATGMLVAYEVLTAPDYSGAPGVSVDTIPGLGEVLVDANGNTLYLFEPDEAASVTCTADCADKWPPLTQADNRGPELGAGVRADLIGTTSDDAGTPVVTYAGWPLYRYESDSVGEASGHEVDENGGTWFALTTSGERAG